jgi:glycosyltransferase involved in cell wall biosynthesis
MNPKVSVIVCTYNNGPFIEKCIDSILCQTITDFELIVVNDASTDNTHELIISCKDPRLRYFRLPGNLANMGKIRGFAVSKAVGEYLFFIDGDCHARQDWLQKGLEAFDDPRIAAVEGRIVYYKDGYRPTLSDGLRHNEKGGTWMTGNMAYRKDILDKLGFNPAYAALEDRELALRILKEKKIRFEPDSVVYHRKITRGIVEYISEVRIAYINEKIRLIRELDDKNDLLSNRLRLFNPLMFLIMLFPPAALVVFFQGRVKSWNDIKLVPFIWVKAIYFRFVVWKTAIHERYFLL